MKLSFNQAWDYLNQFNPKPGYYVQHNLRRFLLTIEWLPDCEARVLDVGGDRYFTLLLSHMRPKYEIFMTGLETARGAPNDENRIHEVTFNGKPVEFQYSYFDIDRSDFPYASQFFDVVLCLEVIEHLLVDPMHMISEINRVLKQDGKLLLTTPNLLSWRSIFNAIEGMYPMEHMKYHPELGFTQHVREYSPWEIQQVLKESSFDIERIHTYEVTETRRLNIMERLLSLLLLIMIPLTCRPPEVPVLPEA